LKDGWVEMGAITQFDWNIYNPTNIVTASIEKICTVWDVQY